jgi:restriction system protein
MAARRRLAEDLFEIGFRLSWRTCVVAAAAAGLGLHFLAAALTTPASAATTATLGAFAVRNLIGTIARLLQFVVPLALLVAALASCLRRSQATTLFRRARTDGLEAVARMSWGQFERLIGEAFRRRGFEAQETGGPSADGGVDLVLSKEGKRYFVQCKHWRTQSVGVGVVRELNGVVAAQGAAGGYVVTSGVFTSEARAFAKSCAIELIDGKALAALIGPSTANAGGGGGPSTGDPVGSECPKCGSAMVRRIAKQGAHAGEAFWGCSRYPECRGTRTIA